MAETLRLEAGAGAAAAAGWDVWAEGVPFRAAVPAADPRGDRVTWPCRWLPACCLEARVLAAGPLTPLAHPVTVAQMPAAAAVSARKAVP
jgi:hypothetical protein